MSMSVVAIMSELPKVGSGDRMRRIVNQQDMAKVRRVLFGPVDHTETRIMLEKEFAQRSALDADRWEFDFINEVPKPTKRRFIWKPNIDGPKVDPCPPKRPYVEEDNSRLYGEPLEEDQRPQATKTKSPASTRQSFITDYMSIRKRQVQQSTKKEVGNVSSGGPTKKARLIPPS